MRVEMTGGICSIQPRLTVKSVAHRINPQADLSYVYLSRSFKGGRKGMGQTFSSGGRSWIERAYYQSVI